MAPLFISLTLMIAAFATAHSLPGGGITLDLIHRDSARLSPHSAISHADKLYASFRRSIARARHFRRAARAGPSAVGARVIPIEGTYVMELAIGNPPSPFIGIVDTGSDLIWTQCQPCTNCFDQDVPVFNPAKSTTYQNLPCDGNECAELPPSGQGCDDSNTCSYRYGYGDRSSTAGDLSTETLTVGQGAGEVVTNIVFGCGHENQGSFRAPGTGLIGLGQGPLSLAAQTKDLPEFGGKFAYCLVPFQSDRNVSSKISFGGNAVVSGRGVVSTPVATGQQDTFYYLTLEGVTVGDQRVAFKTGPGSGSGLSGPDAGSGEASEGNIVIDSGTTLTFLPDAMFEEVVSELKRLIGAEPVADPKGTLQLCYGGEVEVPRIAFHFSGATLELAPENTFIQLQENLVCLSMLPAGRDFALFGNLAQVNFVVGHDLDTKTVSFKPTDCTKYV